VLQAARSFLLHGGKNLDKLGSEHVRQVAQGLRQRDLVCAEKATWMAGEGIQIFGGNGYINEYRWRRLWRDRQALRDRRRHQRDPRMLIGRELFAETM